MAKETLLQKEFREKDIRRIRNLVSGNQGDSTQTQVGYSRKHIERKDGDVWEENGKTWTLKNGIRISISKLERAKLNTLVGISKIVSCPPAVEIVTVCPPL